MEAIRPVNKGVLLEVRVKANSGSNGIFERDGVLFLEIISRPENNEANIEIMTYLGKLFGRRARIIRGLKSRNKVIFIENMTREEIESTLTPQSHKA